TLAGGAAAVSGRAHDMCVYCKGAPECAHERDACATSRGEVCTTCGHCSATIASYKPVSGGVRPTWRVRRKPPTQTPLPQSMAKKRVSPEGPVPLRRTRWSRLHTGDLKSGSG